MSKRSPRWRRRALPAAAATIAALGATLAITPTAAAAQKVECRPQEHVLSHPEVLGASTKIKADLCVARSSDNSEYAAWVENIYWNTTGWSGPPYTDPLYDDIVFSVRLERNNWDVNQFKCDFTKLVNRHRFTQSGDRTKCTPNSWHQNSEYRNGWTADGKLIYDYNLDGKGNKKSAFTGTPEIW